MNGQSLGVGQILDNGDVIFKPTSVLDNFPHNEDAREKKLIDESCSSTSSFTNSSITSSEEDDENSRRSSNQAQAYQSVDSTASAANNMKQGYYGKTFYIRASDLKLQETSEGNEQHCHRIGPLPHPLLDESSHELWVAINENCDSLSLIYPRAISALKELAMNLISDTSKWVAERQTERVLQKASLDTDYWLRNRGPAVMSSVLAKVLAKETLVWTSPDHDAFRSEGIIQQPPKKIFDLLMNSARVKEYNKQSEGRTDLFHSCFVGEKGNEVITKVVKGCNKVPLIRLSLPFMTLFHGMPLDGTNSEGYLIINRTVKEIDENGGVTNTGQGETVVGATLILRIQGDGQKEEYTNQSLVVSMNWLELSGVIKIPKSIGVRSAISFFNGLRSTCP